MDHGILIQWISPKSSLKFISYFTNQSSVVQTVTQPICSNTIITTESHSIIQNHQSSLSMVSQNSSNAGDLDVTVDVLAAKDLVISSRYRFIDVRTTEEFEKGHPDLENALNIPYMFVKPEGGRVKNPEFLEQVSSVFTKEDQIVVGCHSGVRSLYATNDLLEAGFKDVKNMGGGYLAWVENAFAVRKPENKAEADASDEL